MSEKWCNNQHQCGRMNEESGAAIRWNLRISNSSAESGIGGSSLVPKRMTMAPPTYSLSGAAARLRIQPLLPPDWVEAREKVDFLWENAPLSRSDGVRCYSHLPNGTAILDNKRVLAQLYPEGLETYTFEGRKGLDALKECLWRSNDDDEAPTTLVDLLPDLPPLSLPNPHWWVLKDASSNGAGGIWMLHPSNWSELTSPLTSPLFDHHSYVAQAYVWPPVLYGGRKCHVRVYAVLLSNGQAHVHRRAFLHVANDVFDTKQSRDTVHVTNCCANSDDPDKFAGEIPADLEAGSSEECFRTTSGPAVVPLGAYGPAIRRRVAQWAKAVAPWVQGGSANGGFEYLGIDFGLTSDGDAQILEVNAPPSQDTATGLPHAEELHDTVLRDLIHLWVVPKVTGAASVPGGWTCVCQADQLDKELVPSRAALLNKIRWKLHQRKGEFALYARSFFPYFDSYSQPFWENAGGTQVPRPVMEHMVEALRYRHRDRVGREAKMDAERVVKTLVGVDPAVQDYRVFFGANASSLLRLLAERLSRSWEMGDEVVLDLENPSANTLPWSDSAARLGCCVRWWSPGRDDLESLLSPRTRLVALTHASNVLGMVRDVAASIRVVRQLAPQAQIVVDGVAYVAHRYVNLSVLACDWYVLSTHKMYGPHLGVLLGREDAVEAISGNSSSPERLLSIGTVNAEACAGLRGLASYWISLLHSDRTQDKTRSQSSGEVSEEPAWRSLSSAMVKAVYQKISATESRLIEALVDSLRSSPRVRLLTSRSSDQDDGMLPLVSFSHNSVSNETILSAIPVVARQGTFLANCEMQRIHEFEQGVVRFSLAHYNTMGEVKSILKALHSIPNWL